MRNRTDATFQNQPGSCLRGQQRRPTVPTKSLVLVRQCFDDAPGGTDRIIDNHVPGTNLGTLLNGILRRNVIDPWPKTMQSLRLTRRNELESKFPNHVVNGWIGHDSTTAAKHYLMTTPDDWASAETTATGDPNDLSNIVEQPATGGLPGTVIRVNQATLPMTPLGAKARKNPPQSYRDGFSDYPART